jgi:hypothetical protein
MNLRRNVISLLLLVVQDEAEATGAPTGADR